MNFKTPSVLIAVLAGIAAYLFFTRTTLETPVPTKTEEAQKLIDIKPEDVQKLAIIPASGKSEVFERSGSDWKMVEPYPAPAETFAVDDLVRDVVGIQSRGQADADKKASLGLDHPAYKIEVTSKDNKTVKLSVGEKPPFGDTLAVLLDGHENPDVVNVSLYGKLDKKPDTYRQTRLVSVSTDQVKQLSVTRKGQTIRLLKAGNDWEIAEPKKMPADLSAVSDLLFGISGLTAHKFPDGYTAQDAGLTKPRVIIRYSNEAPTTNPTSAATRPAGSEIKLGGYEDVTRDNIYAQVDDGPIATVAASTFDTFNKTALDLRDKKAADIDPDRVESLTVQIDRPATTQPTTRPADNRTFTIARSKEAPAASTAPVTQPLSKWVFRSGGQGNADDGQVSALLSALHPLHAEKYLESAPTTRPAATFTVTVTTGPGGNSGPGEHTVRFVDPGGDARLIGSYSDLVFEVDRALAKDFDGDFKTKKVEATPPPSRPPSSFPPIGAQ